MSAATDFDLIVLGAGSGGLAGALRAAAHGAKVALLEPGPLGGTCVNAGCVPKKAMWFAADLAGRMALARQLGFALPAQVPLDWHGLVLRRRLYIDGIHAAYRERLDKAGIVLLPYKGRLTGMPGEVACADLRWRARHVLLATGGQPRRPDIPGAELGAVSDDFFALSEAPRRVAIIGGGYIAVELSAVLQALGSRVTLLVREPRLLRDFDAEISERLAEHMRQAGVRLHVSTPVCALQRQADGSTQVRGGDGALGDHDLVLFATGRAAHVEGLGLDEAGVRRGERGEILVDAWQNTSRPGTYAVGDVTGQPALTPYAIAAARRLMDRLFGGQPEARVRFEQVPTVVFSLPPLARLGLTAEQAHARHGDDVQTLRADFRPMGQALGDGHARSLFKVVCAGHEQTVVGLHLIGEASDEILQGFAVAMRVGMTLADLRDTLAIHPTAAEEIVLVDA